MKLNAEENYLVSTMGIYGCWLLKHGRQLPKNEWCVKYLMLSYEIVSGRNFKDPDWYQNLEVLGNSVDRVIKELNWEPLFDNYPKALRDLSSIE